MGKCLKSIFRLQKIPENQILIFSLNFKVPNFTQFWGPRQPSFTPFWGPQHPNFTPFQGPRQLLWNPLEGWGKAGDWPKVSLPKLRNTGAPSTNWGALLYYTLYTVHCTLYNFPTHLFRQVFTQFFHTTFPHNVAPNFCTHIFHSNFQPYLSTQFVQ